MYIISTLNNKDSMFKRTKKFLQTTFLGGIIIILPITITVFIFKWLFNLMTILAFASIVMTYFGVNFYLVGLHSYASGDKVITPNFVYWSIFIVFILAVMSRYKFVRYLKK